jgi:hypothetical protein
MKFTFRKSEEKERGGKVRARLLKRGTEECSRLKVPQAMPVSPNGKGIFQRR